MFVSCPHCGFLVALIVRQDGATQRCPRCDGLVQPGATAETEAPQAAVETGPVDDEAVEAVAFVSDDEPAPPPTGSDALDDEPPAPDGDEQDRFERNIAAAAIASTTTRRAPRRTPRPRRQHAGPSFARAQANAQARAGWRWYAAVAALVLLLGAQLLLAQRNELAADARWRPLVSAVCGVAFCDLPAWHEPAAFTMLQRSVRPATDRPGTLAVEASFRNDARWPQRWPTLQLSLSDIDGQPVGARAFTPDQYRREHRPDDVLAPGESATVRLDVVEPAPRIVAFTFDFR